MKGGDWFVDVYARSGATNYILVVTLSAAEATAAQTGLTPIGEPVSGSRNRK
ncbi:MAG: hypothetical protein U0350_01605 [Caldilineaceae bacterium]